MKFCYLCGVPLKRKVNKSKDHIPPDCFFPSDTQYMITVPCCIDCNRKYRPLDEKMRNYITSLTTHFSLEPYKKGKKAVLKSPKLIKEYLSHTKQHPNLKDESGQPRLIFYFNQNELGQWLIRLVKGLYFHENGRRIDENAIFEAKSHPEIYPPPSDTFKMEKGLERRPYFIYGVVKDDINSNIECWVFIFYERLIFSIVVKTPS